jgi:endonuclease/exonuclease/phosphatase family metal-dependent hydrolase
MIPPGRDAVTGTTLKVMSYNILYNGGLNDRRKVIGTIRNVNPDIVCCIEFNFQGDREVFDRELGSLYPYALESETPKNAKSGAIIYSKYPVKRTRIPDASTWKNGWEGRVSVIFAELAVNGRRVNLVNYHLKSVGHYIEYIADKNYTLREKMDWAAKYEEKNDREKFTQAKSLVEIVSPFHGPTILCGDLNDTPNSRAFLTILRRFRNTFSEKGWGLGATFGGSRIREKLAWIPFVRLLACDVLRIDHIFVSRDVKVVSSSVLSEAVGSDHKPVVSVISIGEADR